MSLLSPSVFAETVGWWQGGAETPAGGREDVWCSDSHPGSLERPFPGCVGKARQCSNFKISSFNFNFFFKKKLKIESKTPKCLTDICLYSVGG